MSTTAAGWVQASVLVFRPFGDWMAAAFSWQRHLRVEQLAQARGLDTEQVHRLVRARPRARPRRARRADRQRAPAQPRPGRPHAVRMS